MKLTPIAAVVCALEICALAAPTPEALYAEGKDAYDAADYVTAIKKWQRAYKLSGAPALLLNLGQAYRLSGDCPHALANYREFVATGPKGDDRKLASDFIAELEPKCGEPAVEQPADRPVAKPEPGGAMKTSGLVIGGAGLVSIAIGIGFGYHASTIGDDVMRECSVAMPCAGSLVKAADADGRRDTTVGYAFDAVGALALLGGAALYYFGDHASAVEITPRASRSGETGAVLTWRTTW
jgi:tetratricopeptide (TPR) repeat protein